MSFAFDDDKNWREPTDDELQLIDAEMPRRLAGKMAWSIIISTVFLIALVLLALIEIYSEHRVSGYLITCLILCPLLCGYLFYSYFNQKKCISKRKLSVQSGTVSDKKIERSQSPLGSSFKYHICFESDKGNQKDIDISIKEHHDFAKGDGCLIMKIEPKGPGYKDPIEIFKL